MTTGFVYFAANEHGHIKVGFSKDPITRMQGILYGGTQRPDCSRIRLLAQIVGSFTIETSLHEQLRPFRIDGTSEWYWSNPGLRELILRIAERFEDPPISTTDVHVTLCLSMSSVPIGQAGMPYDSSWALDSIPEEQFNSEHARRNSLKRKTHSGGKHGRPRSNAPRCPCGKMTAKRAESRNHKCH